jgi:uncharacterized membrane protein YidH (DUF202 family)
LTTGTDDTPLPLAKAFRTAYPVGLFLCVAWPLALQLMLGTIIRRGATPPGGVAQQLGYTFSGLTMLLAFYVTWRWDRTRKSFRAAGPAQPAILLRETLLYAALLEFTSVFGVLYYALGGPLAERYSRSFIALTTVMFFVFVPRLDAWRRAAQGE